MAIFGPKTQNSPDYLFSKMGSFVFLPLSPRGKRKRAKIADSHHGMSTHFSSDFALFSFRYALPLFFVVVKTNIDYQVVAAFVVESETERAISEALQVIQEWNPDFQPRVFMTDYDTSEIGAIKRVFGTY